MALYQEYVDNLLECANKQDEMASSAVQILRLHHAAKEIKNPIFLELGTDHGQSTKVILNALDGKEGSLVSVDIRDCSNAGQGENWTFIQSDSTDVEYILSKAPFLKDGIDFLYIDSLHEFEHVKKELYGFFPFIKKGGQIFFDDVDSTPYMRNRRKDNVGTEIANRKISKLIKDVFYDNMDHLKLEIMYGSTGLAVLTKTSKLNDVLKPYNPLTKPRQCELFWRIVKKIAPTMAQKRRNTEDEFLIAVDNKA